MPKEDFDAVVKPKVDGSWNLHATLPGNLDFFILFSSLAGVAPSFGQANYAAGNAYQNALAGYRISCGEKAVSIDMGMVVDAGFVAQPAGLAEQLEARGATPVYVEDILGLLEYYCDDSLPLLSPEESQAIIGLQTTSALRAQGIDEPYWLQRPLFSYLSRTRGGDASSGAASSEGQSAGMNAAALETLLPAATSLEEAAAVVCDALITRLAKILVMEPADIQVHKPVNAHGVDSLVAMELRQWFRKAVRADVATFQILANTPMERLAAKVAGRSELLKRDKLVDGNGETHG
jgi:aryl carrier-like protein